MTRQCGDCQLCCKLVPVKELNKRAGERCQHQRHGKGCIIYSRRPNNCRLWSCRWLTGLDTADLRRPDRSHYVIDCMGEFIKVLDNETGHIHSIPCIQIWNDPRFSASLMPPAMTSDGRWHEQRGTPEGEHSAAEVAEALAEHGLSPVDGIAAASLQEPVS